MKIYNKIADDVVAEIGKAVEKFPEWPDDMMHAALIVGEENGELQKSVLQANYEKNKGINLGHIREEAIQTAAMAMRFVASIDSDEYRYPNLSQHKQNIDEQS